MAMQEIAPSNEQQVDVSDINEAINLTEEQAEQVANEILNDPNITEQVEEFSALWNSLNPEQKSNLAKELTMEIQDSIKELKDLGIEYNPEVTNEDVDNVRALEFVRENQEKIPQSRIKLEKKANDVVKAMWQEIQDKGILDTEKS